MSGLTHAELAALLDAHGVAPDLLEEFVTACGMSGADPSVAPVLPHPGQNFPYQGGLWPGQPRTSGPQGNHAYPTSIGTTRVLTGTAPMALLRQEFMGLHAIVLSLGLVPHATPPAIGGRVNALATVEWGVGGANFSAEVDFHQGVTLTLNADQVGVSARLLQNPFADGVGDLAAFQQLASAAITFGNRGARSQPTRSFPQVTLTPAGGAAPSTDIPVPPFGHAFYLGGPQRIFATGAITVTFFGVVDPAAETQLVVDGTIFAQALRTEDGVRFPEPTRTIRVTNNDNLNPVDLTAWFSLSL